MNLIVLVALGLLSLAVGLAAPVAESMAGRVFGIMTTGMP